MKTGRISIIVLCLCAVLFYAVKNSDLKQAKAYLAQGADPNVQDEDERFVRCTGMSSGQNADR